MSVEKVAPGRSMASWRWPETSVATVPTPSSKRQLPTRPGCGPDKGAELSADVNSIAGRHIASLQVPAHTTVGDALPLDVGRNGPASGKHWLGKLDDLRIWSIA